MDAKQLKQYICDNNLVQEVLEEIGCHHVRWHSSGYYTSANIDGDNQSAITIYLPELSVVNYTRSLPVPSDIITLTEFNKKLNFFEAFKYLCNFLNLDVHAQIEDGKTEAIRMGKMLNRMKTEGVAEDTTPIKEINENILSYYHPYVNDFWKKDHVPYTIQREWELGYDETTNRITIPIRDEWGRLVGVKGRLFKKELGNDDLKYIYIEPCPRAKILYGLYKTHNYIKESGRVYIGESEKFTHQLWSYDYKNCISIGGLSNRKISNIQVEKLTRLGVDIVLCFDQDITKNELEAIADQFLEGINVYAIIDENGILGNKESPSDDPLKWEKLVQNNLYKIR